MIIILNPVIDKLTIQYKLTLPEYKKLLYVIEKLFKTRITIRDSKQKETYFLFSKSIKAKKQTTGNVHINFFNKWTIHNNQYKTHDFFVSFNPSKTGKILDEIVKFIHSFLDRKWCISTIDLAFDVNQAISNILIFAPNRRMRTFIDTHYFGRRNSDGSVKMYNKAVELNKQSEDTLTRIEYTHKPTKKYKVPYRLNINECLNSRYSIHFLNKLEIHEKEYLIEHKNKPLNKLSKKTRIIIKKLKGKSFIPILINELTILRSICCFLSERNTYKIIWKYLAHNNKKTNINTLLFYLKKFIIQQFFNKFHLLIMITFTNIILFFPLLC